MGQAARQGQRNDDGAGGVSAGEETILGVDTHKDAHVATAITVLGAPLAVRSFPATVAGYRQLPAWARFGVLRRPGWTAPAAKAPGWPATCAARTCRWSR
jgi:hypothetical protein